MARQRSMAAVFLALALTSCGALQYDLSGVPVPLDARPAPAGQGKPLRIERKSVLWGHGLFGQTAPDVAALVTEASRGYSRVAGFKVTQAAGFHDWLLTHVSATLARVKTVVIEGQLIERP